MELIGFTLFVFSIAAMFGVFPLVFAWIVWFGLIIAGISLFFNSSFLYTKAKSIEKRIEKIIVVGLFASAFFGWSYILFHVTLTYF